MDKQKKTDIKRRLTEGKALYCTVWSKKVGRIREKKERKEQKRNIKNMLKKRTKKEDLTDGLTGEIVNIEGVKIERDEREK
jgi:hypothetical protein